jgi:hypothetical protein
VTTVQYDPVNDVTLDVLLQHSQKNRQDGAQLQGPYGA